MLFCGKGAHPIIRLFLSNRRMDRLIIIIQLTNGMRSIVLSYGLLVGYHLFAEILLIYLIKCVPIDIKRLELVIVTHPSMLLLLLGTLISLVYIVLIVVVLDHLGAECLLFNQLLIYRSIASINLLFGLLILAYRRLIVQILVYFDSINSFLPTVII